MPELITISVIVALVALILLILSLVVINEYERGVIFRFGHVVGVLRPGLRMRIPFGIDVVHKIDIRVHALDVPDQEIITKDNVSIRVDAVVYYHISDPALVVTKVADVNFSTSMLGQTNLRSVLGQHELDEILTNVENISLVLKNLLSATTSSWGIFISAVELKSIEIPDAMKRAMARQAEAERERRAKVTAAEGEEQAATQLYKASEIISASPAALQLRYLQTLNDIAAEKNSTIIFPIPMEIISAFGNLSSQKPLQVQKKQQQPENQEDE